MSVSAWCSAVLPSSSSLPRSGWAGAWLVCSLVVAGCGGGGGEGAAAAGAAANESGVAAPALGNPTTAPSTANPGAPDNPAPATTTTGVSLPAPGNLDGRCAVPADAQAVRVAAPDRVVGTGTPASCTGEAVVNAVAQGGHIGFNCGPDPVTIVMSRTAKVFNNRPDVVLDGGGKVTLSGAGRVRILYQNTCDPAQVWTTATCDRQSSPQLTVQNLALVNGNSTGQTYGQPEVQGGGAVYARGGALRIVNSRFTANQCEPTGQDLGGGAVRAFGVPTSISHSTFGGAAGEGNVCANGGAVSGLGSSLRIYNSAFSDNRAVAAGHHDGEHLLALSGGARGR